MDWPGLQALERKQTADQEETISSLYRFDSRLSLEGRRSGERTGNGLETPMQE